MPPNTTAVIPEGGGEELSVAATAQANRGQKTPLDSEPSLGMIQDGEIENIVP